jgi:hypothetical protein
VVVVPLVPIDAARLMAGAPDMLAALKRVCSVIDAAGTLNLSNGVQLGQTAWYMKITDAMTDARAAITKATEAA